MLQKLSGRTHTVITGVALCRGGRCRSLSVSTAVHFRTLTEAQVRWYVSTGEPMDKAGAYALQGAAAVFIDAVDGSYTNVIGLPLAETMDLLAEDGLRPVGAAQPGRRAGCRLRRPPASARWKRPSGKRRCVAGATPPRSGSSASRRPCRRSKSGRPTTRGCGGSEKTTCRRPWGRWTSCRPTRSGTSSATSSRTRRNSWRAPSRSSTRSTAPRSPTRWRKSRRPRGVTQPVLLQANLAGEETKEGATAEGVLTLARRAAEWPHLAVRGLMALPPYEEDAERSRPHFRALRELAGRVRALELPGVEMTELSMGMSHDFTVAIEEGATLVRVGTALFGARAVPVKDSISKSESDSKEIRGRGRIQLFNLSRSPRRCDAEAPDFEMEYEREDFPWQKVMHDKKGGPCRSGQHGRGAPRGRPEEGRPKREEVIGVEAVTGAPRRSRSATRSASPPTPPRRRGRRKMIILAVKPKDAAPRSRPWGSRAGSSSCPSAPG